ncbi:nucleotidyltransferase family protein [Clostridium felsineum]|uniref:nucleotidyltransferase family protein n=1 Tax=Clostridium felsineum TaxID=36839 RepID=UPI00098C6A9B|nr:nucleotidyltransferase family protein [Clostridium felsineum]URZ14865.1 D-glycero-alpha-D-manno-heptose 1-phosphate guanylyltransferase [Clostridium felsineum DSM 794]
MQALILVGGLGTRLRSIVKDRPKPMALIEDKPFLEYLIRNLKKNGIKDIILATGYMSEIIEDYFKDGREFGVNIVYSKENVQLGTAGAIKNAEKYIKDEVFVLNGDTYFDVDFKKLYEFHKNTNSIFTMVLRKIADASRYGAVECDKENKITSFVEKGETSKSDYINGGIYIIKKKILNLIENEKKVSLEKEVIPKVLREEKIYGYGCGNYFIDIGIPEDYIKFCTKVKRGEKN